MSEIGRQCQLLTGRTSRADATPVAGGGYQRKGTYARGRVLVKPPDELQMLYQAARIWSMIQKAHAVGDRCSGEQTLGVNGGICDTWQFLGILCCSFAVVSSSLHHSPLRHSPKSRDPGGFRPPKTHWWARLLLQPCPATLSGRPVEFSGACSTFCIGFDIMTVGTFLLVDQGQAYVLFNWPS